MGLAFAEIHDTPQAIVVDLAIVGLFFLAMRSCENTTTPQPGKNTADMCGLTSLDSNKREIPQDHPGLALVVYVTFLFADQKNGDKNTSDPRNA